MNEKAIPRYDEFMSRVARELVVWAYEKVETGEERNARKKAMVIRRVADRIEHRYRKYPWNSKSWVLAVPEKILALLGRSRARQLKQEMRQERERNLLARIDNLLDEWNKRLEDEFPKDKEYDDDYEEGWDYGYMTALWACHTDLSNVVEKWLNEVGGEDA